MATDKYLEVELRYKIPDVEACLVRLKGLGVTVARTDHLIDDWYEPVAIKSLAEQRDWFDNQKGIAWRIRRSGEPGRERMEVTSKQLTDDNNHNSFHETTAKFASYDEAARAMVEKNYRNWLTVDKTRYYLTSTNPQIKDDEFELVIDHIAGLKEKIGVGACLEIERKGSESREQALKRIEIIAGLLGFSAEDQFEMSLTVTSMSALARF
ncbi:MAG TPA: CYTH domain-containing protein [Patescibacteria group bacterium]|nr:CYTH domain-containing protein [Patescibacteria group bacterium]